MRSSASALSCRTRKSNAAPKSARLPCARACHTRSAAIRTRMATDPRDEVCFTCGVGFYLPSGVCDHCDQPFMSEPIKPKRSPALPRVWKSLWHVPCGNTFYSPAGNGKILCRKTTIISGSADNGHIHLLLPWTRVRTAELLRDAKHGGKRSAAITHAPLSDASHPENFSATGHPIPVEGALQGSPGAELFAQTE